MSAYPAADRLNRFLVYASRLESGHQPGGKRCTRGRLPYRAEFAAAGEQPLVLSNRSDKTAKVLVLAGKQRTFATRSNADCARGGRLETIAICAGGAGVGRRWQRPSVRQRGGQALCAVPGMEPPRRIQGRGGPIVRIWPPRLNAVFHSSTGFLMHRRGGAAAVELPWRDRSRGSPDPQHAERYAWHRQRCWIRR